MNTMRAVIFILIGLLACLSLNAAKPSESLMRSIGQRAGNGDLTAIEKLMEIKTELYKDIDRSRDRERMIENARLMRTAFGEIGKKIRREDVDGPALKAIRHTLEYTDLAGFAADALGDAAARGNKVALDMLLNYKTNRILLSSATFALGEAADKEIPEAVEFMIDIMNNESHRALWREASSHLANAARHGNTRAKQAMQKYQGR